MSNKEYIQQALGITADEYLTAVEAGGYEWINRFFKDDEFMLGVFKSSAMFWKWWVNQWEIRDEEFVRNTGIDVINEPLEGRYWKAAFAEYVETHDTKKLQIIPNRWVRAEVAQAIINNTK